MERRGCRDQADTAREPFDRAVRRRILDPEVPRRGEQERGQRDRGGDDPPAEADQRHQRVEREEGGAPLGRNDREIARAVDEPDAADRDDRKA